MVYPLFLAWLVRLFVKGIQHPYRRWCQMRVKESEYLKGFPRSSSRSIPPQPHRYGHFLMRLQGFQYRNQILRRRVP